MTRHQESSMSGIILLLGSSSTDWVFFRDRLAKNCIHLRIASLYTSQRSTYRIFNRKILHRQVRMHHPIPAKDQQVDLRLQMALTRLHSHTDLDRPPKAVCQNSSVSLHHNFRSRGDTASQHLLRRQVKRQRRTVTSLRVESAVSSDQRASLSCARQ